MKKMTDNQLKKLSQMSDAEIDFSDIPEIKKTDKFIKLYPQAKNNMIITDKMMFEALSKVMDAEPKKIPVTLKLDSKVIDFFKQHSKKYQTKINEVLTAFVTTYEKAHRH